ncbi:hypothetical protein DL98DRAFT_365509, partial [Cadophora sp. DSE1049]
ASNFIFGSQTLVPGSAITVNGQQVSAAASGGAIVLNPAPPQSASPPSVETSTGPAPAVVVVDGTSITGNTASGFVIVILNGATATRNPTTFSTEIQAPVTSLVVAGQTLTAGGRVTVGGDVLSLAGGAITVIGTVTVGGREATATATPTGKKKSSGMRVESNSCVYMALQISFMF